MPHNRFYINQPLEENSTYTLEEEELHHMVRVMRQSIGDEIELVDGKGSLGIAKIISISKKTAELEILSLLKEKEPSKKFSIAIANLKPSSLEFAVEKLTELGAYEIIVFPGVLSEKAQVSNHTKNRLDRILISSLKQSGRLYLPKLTYTELKDVLKKKCFYCDLEKSAEKLSTAIVNLTEFTLLIGPEQGWHEKEKKILREKATACLLHRNILRAETAAITASAIASQMLY